MSHAAPHRKRVARSDPFHPASSLVLRLRVFLRRDALDRLLAAGGDPSWGADLELRAEQLTAWGKRHALAECLERTIDEAQRPPRWSCAAPLDRPAVRAAIPELLALAAGLEAEASPTPQGVALAEQLMQNASSPLFAPGDEDALRESAEIAWRALR
jgi:hypothetical protein